MPLILSIWMHLQRFQAVIPSQLAPYVEVKKISSSLTREIKEQRYDNMGDISNPVSLQLKRTNLANGGSRKRR